MFGRLGRSLLRLLRGPRRFDRELIDKETFDVLATVDVKNLQSCTCVVGRLAPVSLANLV